MLISTENPYTDLSAVASATVGDFWPYMVLIIGIVLAFYILEILIDIIRPPKDRLNDRVDRDIKETEDLLR